MEPLRQVRTDRVLEWLQQLQPEAATLDDEHVDVSSVAKRVCEEDCGTSADGGDTKRRKHSDGQCSPSLDPQPGAERRRKSHRRLHTELVVGNILTTTTTAHIVEVFSHYGEVKRVMTRQKAQSRFMQALISFKDPGAVQRVLAHREQRVVLPIPSGRFLSTTSNSFPNRVRSCPLGVDEKKEIGAPKTDFVIAS